MDLQIDKLTNVDIFEIVEKAIANGEEISFFEPYYKILSKRTAFYATTIKNDFFYRGRIAKNTLFENIDELKYPALQHSKKGRLNDNNEVITYLSTSELAILAELDLDYYQLFCIVKVAHVHKNTVFFYVGVNGDYESNRPDVVEINKFYDKLVSNKSTTYYNATISLARHLLKTKIVGFNREAMDVGIIYSSVQDYKTNKSLYNVAVPPDVFDTSMKMIEANYCMLGYDYEIDSIILHEVNKGTIIENGQIKWQKTYNEMVNELDVKHGNEIFKIFDDAIVHYGIGSGKIVKDDKDFYTVEFRSGEKEIKKSGVREVKKISNIK